MAISLSTRSCHSSASRSRSTLLLAGRSGGQDSWSRSQCYLPAHRPLQATTADFLLALGQSGPAPFPPPAQSTGRSHSEQAIKTFYLSPQRPSIRALVREIALNCETEKLPAPTFRTIKRRLAEGTEISTLPRTLGHANAPTTSLGNRQGLS